jgi:hypothetical protein
MIKECFESWDNIELITQSDEEEIGKNRQYNC